MGLDRDEIALRFACALLSREGSYGAEAPTSLAIDAVRLAEGFTDYLTTLVPPLTASKPSPAPVTPPTEAKRPTHVRHTGIGTYNADVCRRVLRWNGDNPTVGVWRDNGQVVDETSTMELVSGEWEPCSPPAPVEPANGDAARLAAVAILKTFRKRLKWDGRAGDWILRSEIGDEIYPEDPTHVIDDVLAALARATGCA
jgi:hypothetical protein